MIELRAALAASLALAPITAAPAAPDPAVPTETMITLSNFKFRPGEIHLKAGEPTRMRLVNRSGSSHSFSAPEFFRAVRVRPEDASSIVGGSISVAPHGEMVVVFIPEAGRFRVECGNHLHKAKGMTGAIVVE